MFVGCKGWRILVLLYCLNSLNPFKKIVSPKHYAISYCYFFFYLTLNFYLFSVLCKSVHFWSKKKFEERKLPFRLINIGEFLCNNPYKSEFEFYFKCQIRSKALLDNGKSIRLSDWMVFWESNKIMCANVKYKTRKSLVCWKIPRVDKKYQLVSTQKKYYFQGV